MVKNEVVTIEVVPAKKVKGKAVKIDGKYMNRSDFAKYFKITISRVNKIIIKDNAEEKIAHMFLAKHHGLSLRSKIYRIGDGYTWAADVAEQTGLTMNVAHGRLRAWLQSGDCDELYRPVEVSRRNRRVPAISASPTAGIGRRRVIEDLKPIGTWEAQNL